ncbi:sensor histidine kinase, partial [Bacteroides uniformis]
MTLIYGPCEKIISYDKSDSLIIKYAKLIKHNAEELNSLIAELIEFRRLETGHKKVEIKSCPISELARNIAEPFSELTSNKLLDYRINIVDNIYWNSDSGCLNKIITNLISNAFKYASVKGKISVDVYVEDKKLYIVVANTGKGIKEDDLSKIFDRYTVLDNFEDQNKAHETSRNGLGLAICNNMVKLLEGEITVTSVLNDITTFTVILPELSIEQATEGDEFFGNASVTVIENVSRKMEETSSVPEIVIPEYDKNKQTIMIIDDDSAMLWFVTEIFIDKYNV